jgi:AraC family transcriptional regulator
MIHEVNVQDVPERLVLSRRLVVTARDLGPTISGTFERAYEAIGAAGVVPAGPPCVVYHQKLDGGQRWDLEICAPIGAAFEPPEGFALTRLPAERVAALLHRGPYEALAAAYTSMVDWIEEHDLTVAGPPREVYLSPPGTPPAEIQTIIEWPVSEALVLMPS